MSGEDSQPNTSVWSGTEEKLDPTDDHDPASSDTAPKSGLPGFLFPLILGLTVLGITGWIVFRNVIMPILMFSQMKPQPTFVELSSPKTATIEDSSEYAANLDSRQSVTLQPRVSGQVSAIYVQAGARVGAGTPLLQIDAAEQRADVASRVAAAETSVAEVQAAQADVASARDNLRALEARRAAAQADVALNQSEYRRYQELYQQGAASRQVLEQRLNAIRTAEATLRQAEADMQAQRAAIARAQAQVVRSERVLEQNQANIAAGRAQLRYYSITAPFAGIVGDIPVKEGDFVSTETQLLTVTQNQQLEIQIAIPLERAPKVRLGLPVRLLDDQGKAVQTGRVSFIAPNVDPSTQSVQVKAVFPNVTNQLRTQQFVRTRVVWDTKPGVLVPTSAISRLGGRNFIFMAQPYSASGCQQLVSGGGGPAPTNVAPDQLVSVQKPITLGKIVGNDQEVLEGVSTRDRIIATGILQLQACTPIAEAPPPTPAAPGS